jgi:hypothetical protein
MGYFATRNSLTLHMMPRLFSTASGVRHNAKDVLADDGSCKRQAPIDQSPRHRHTFHSAVSLYGLCQGGLSIGDRSAHLFFPLSVSLFDLRARFCVPTCTSLAAGAHRSCQGWPSHQTFPTSSAVARPHLDSFEHDGTLGAIGMPPALRDHRTPTADETPASTPASSLAVPLEAGLEIAKPLAH